MRISPRGASTTPPRVLLFSQRNRELTPWFGSQYEFEDVISEVDYVRLLAPGIPSQPRGAMELVRRTRDHWRIARGGWKVPRVEPVQVDGDYDLFFGVFHFAQQFQHLEALHGWRERCRTAICFIVELWTSYVGKNERSLKFLDQFDHVFLLNRSTIPTLARYTSTPLSFMPLAVDAERFAPVPHAPERVIDFYNFGRRSPVTHEALLRLVEKRGITYVYDSLKGQMIDYREHRDLVANLMKRSRYFFTYRINDSPERQDRTRGEEGLSTRYFEAAAGGAVMLGSRPACSEYDECFDWPDATIEIPYEANDIEEIVAQLDAQPQRLEKARTNNVYNVLQRHDWLYRWQQVLETAGLEPTPEMKARATQLEQLANLIRTGSGEQVVGSPVTASDR